MDDNGALKRGDSADTIRFGTFELDVRAGELRKEGSRIRLGEQPFLVLLMLLERPGKVVLREEIRDKLWPNGTVVEFGPSINAAIQRLRDALEDSADEPRYVETVARRGYRFIGGLVREEPAVKHLQDSLPSPHDSRHDGLRTRTWLVASATAVVLLAVAGGWFWWSSKRTKPVERPLTRLTSNGASEFPAISPDGKLIAYRSFFGGEPNIFVQQISGGKAIQITHEKHGVGKPVFSPDGTKVIYVMGGLGQIHEVPALGGMPRLVASDGDNPFYTPDGSSVVFVRHLSVDNIGGWYIFTVPRSGGAAVALRPDFKVRGGPIISSDGHTLLAVGYRRGHTEDLRRWWKISLPAGKLESITLPQYLEGETMALEPLALIASRSSFPQWAFFGRPVGDAYNLFRVAINNSGAPIRDPEQLTFTSGHADNPSISSDGRMVFESRLETANIWSLPIDTNSGRISGELQNLTQVEGVVDAAPTLSHDGKLVVYFSNNRLVWKDLTSGAEKLLAPDIPVEKGDPPSISQDGGTVAYYNIRPSRAPDLYVMSMTARIPRLVCQECGYPRGFSSDGRRVLVVEGRGDHQSGFAWVELATGKVMDPVYDTGHRFQNPALSSDEKWMLFVMWNDRSDWRYRRIFVTPVKNLVPAGQDRWIELTHGDYRDDWPMFSPNGNMVYFNSNRDGSTCVWALRLDPKTKRPLGSPFVIRHFHDELHNYSAPWAGYVLNVARDRIVTCLEDKHSDIWMSQLEQ